MLYLAIAIVLFFFSPELFFTLLFFAICVGVVYFILVSGLWLLLVGLVVLAFIIIFLKGVFGG